MKKRLFAFVLLLCLLVSATAFAALPAKPDGNDYVYDFTTTLDERDKESIRLYGAALEEATKAHAVAVIVDALDGARIEDYATDSSISGALAIKTVTTAWSCCSPFSTARCLSAQAPASTAP